MEKTDLSPSTSTAELCGFIFAACFLLLRRAYYHILAAVRAAAKWLKTKHNFTPNDDDGDIVIMTGYQYILFAVAVFLMCMILSIKID